MDIQRLREEGSQNELREALGSILVNEGLTQKALAQDLKISEALLSRFLRRDTKYVPGIKLLLRMAHGMARRKMDLRKVF